MAKRDYQQHCSVAQSLDVIGERWTLLIVRELLLGPRRFKDLLGHLPGIGTNLLSNRLKQLEAEGLLEKTRLPAPASADAYRLTHAGRALEPIVLAVIRWGLPRMDRWDDDTLWSASWTPLTFKALFRPDLATQDALAVFRVGEETFHVGVRGKTLATAPGEPEADTPDVVVRCSPGQFLQWPAQRPGAKQALPRGMRVEGDPSALQSLMQCFPVPGD